MALKTTLDPATLGLSEVREAYGRNENVLRLLRDTYQLATNEQSGILVSYDLQAGTYVATLRRDPAHRARLGAYASAVARVLAGLGPASVLEAGVGEATTLHAVAGALADEGVRPGVWGFDLSWSRVRCGLEYWRAEGGGPVELFVGELEAMALPDAAFDLVFTSHAIEPNHGREAEILRELFRVAGRYAVLLEPAFEFARDEVRARMEAHGYCRGLADAAVAQGWRVLEHRLFDVSMSEQNPTALLVLEKPAAAVGRPAYACPVCRAPLRAHAGQYFCGREGLVFPVIGGVPCLLRANAILASKFGEY